MAVVAEPDLEEFRERIGCDVSLPGRRSGSTRLRPASRGPSGGSLSLSEARGVETEDAAATRTAGKIRSAEARTTLIGQLSPEGIVGKDSLERGQSGLFQV